MSNLYYNDFASHAIKQVSKYGGEARIVNKKRLAKPPVDIKVVHSLKQPISESSPPLPGTTLTFLQSMKLCMKTLVLCLNYCMSVMFE